LPFVFTDIEVLVIIAALLIVVYVVGTYWKHTTLRGYAHWFEEELSSKGNVKFASHGHAGLRIKCEVKGTGGSVKEMHFALTLGARENLMYYPFALLTHDSDRLNCWAVLHRPIQSSLKIMKRSDKKRIDTSENNPSLNAVKSNGLEELGYVMYASDRSFALDLISKASIPERLRSTKDVEFVEFDRLQSKLHMVAKLRKESLSELVDLMFVLGKSA
jgi:hypothetical protein